MHLFAALVPPREALERVHTLVAAIAPVPEATVDTRSPIQRLLGRRPRPEAAPPTQPMLDLLPTAQMHLLVAKFGNLPLAEATRLATTLDEEAQGWATPRLHLSGGIALEPEGDDSVWVRLAGDLDQLDEVRKGVARVAQGLQLFVDRRAFRPHVRIGTINSRTTTAYLEQLLAALDEFESTSWWQTTVSLLIPTELGPGQPPYKDFRDVPLGPAADR
jgi:RNA 2',3'-cyclic 3'-phosphodiesterase